MLSWMPKKKRLILKVTKNQPAEFLEFTKDQNLNKMGPALLVNHSVYYYVQRTSAAYACLHVQCS